MAEIGMHEAKTQLSKLVERVEAGERRGEGFASLAGAWRGRVDIADDFDELPDDLAEAFGTRP